MTNQNFSRPGAIDLSSLAAKADQDKAIASGASYVLELTEELFQQVAQDSTRYPVILAFYSPRDTNGERVINDLAELANQAEGKWLLAKVNVDQQPAIAQAVGVQAVPTVIALLGGQAAPLFQGTQEKAQLIALMTQIEQVALANGLNGRATPVATTQVDENGNSYDPRFKDADDALQRGDYDQAVAEFDKLLKVNPQDSQAQAGKAQAGLLARTQQLDPMAINDADQAPNDLELALKAADIEILQGNLAQGFNRLIAQIRITTGQEREKIRLRLIELFDTVEVGNPEVAKARRDLSLALF